MSFLLHDPVMRPLDEAGAIMPLCYLVFYETGTTTPTPVYSDDDLLSELGTDGVVVSDSAGEFPAIYGDSAVVYRRQLYDADDVLISDTDPMHPHAQFPAGTMVMFYGDSTARDAAYPPALWELADGDNSTPDMRGRLPIGADGATYVADGTGYGSAPGNVESSSNGAHTHTGATGSTAADLAAHTHFVAANVIQGSATAPSASNYVAGETTVGGDTEYDLQGTATAATVGLTSSTGAGGGHTHTIGSDGAHTHTTAVPLPPCRALWFLMRKP